MRPVRWDHAWVATLFAPDDRTVLGVMEDHRCSLCTLHDPVVTALRTAWTDSAMLMTDLAIAQLLRMVASSQPTCLLATISPMADDGMYIFPVGCIFFFIFAPSTGPDLSLTRLTYGVDTVEFKYGGGKRKQMECILSQLMPVPSESRQTFMSETNNHGTLSLYKLNA